MTALAATMDAVRGAPNDDDGDGEGTLSDQAYRRLSRAIARCELAPGTILVERYASAELGMSRTPFREAISRLEKDGLIRILPRRGGQVTLLDLDDIRNNLEVREALEKMCVERALRDGLPFDVARLAQLVKEMGAAVRASDAATFLEADEQFHLTVVAAARNGRALDALKTAWVHINRARHLQPTSKTAMQRSLAQHQAILVQLRERDPEGVRKAIADHTGYAAELSANLMQRVPEAFTSD